MKDYLIVKEAAKYLKKSPSTVRRLIRDRKLKATKLAGKYGVFIIERNELMQYMMEKMSKDIEKASG